MAPPQGHGQGRRGEVWVGRGRGSSPWSPLPFALVQEGGGEAWGLTTGAKALFCFTAEMTLAGEKENMPCALLQFDERLTEEVAIVGLDGTTAIKQKQQKALREDPTAQRRFRDAPNHMALPRSTLTQGLNGKHDSEWEAGISSFFEGLKKP